MKKTYIKTAAGDIPVRYFDAIIIGTGAAGYGCAYSFSEAGADISRMCIVTEGKMMGTSRNTGSDKQTYYKLSATDSAVAMAKDMMASGSMHGDIALTEAMGSTRAFYRLVSIGVPFPHNEYGEYVGYRTDHDTAGRATSTGPLTSKHMTEALEKRVIASGFPIYDGYRAVAIIKDGGRSAGVLTVSRNEITENNRFGYAVFASENTVLAAGGPSSVYASSVYPESQSCGLGIAFDAGADGANLTESQYGLASCTPRWNVSGSYQQVLPRYVSVDDDGNEYEFLADYIGDGYVLPSTFRKGYEWPFSPSRTGRGGSSEIDLAVFAECERGRRVYLDFTRNPRQYRGLESAGDEAADYLKKSGCRSDTPIGRLDEMNRPAIELYKSFGVDLYRDKLEISVSAQHCNGGVAVDKWYESTVSGLFVIGEAAGVFGVQRPGGSALNSTQVGGIRACEMIMSRIKSGGCDVNITEDGIKRYLMPGGNVTRDNAIADRYGFSSRMTSCASFIRNRDEIGELIVKIREKLKEKPGADDFDARLELYINRDTYITQYAMLSSIAAYIDDGGTSRGSYMIKDGENVTRIDTYHADYVGGVKISHDGDMYSAETYFEHVRPIPTDEYWFENVYRDYVSGDIYKK